MPLMYSVVQDRHTVRNGTVEAAAASHGSPSKPPYALSCNNTNQLI